MKFECIGCAGKVPDPEKRQQVLCKQNWAQQEIGYANAEGLLSEANRMRRLVRDCETELAEMDLIEAYREDEATDLPRFQIEYR